VSPILIPEAAETLAAIVATGTTGLASYSVIKKLIAYLHARPGSHTAAVTDHTAELADLADNLKANALRDSELAAVAEKLIAQIKEEGVARTQDTQSAAIRQSSLRQTR